jgi:hypothetical protein
MWDRPDYIRFVQHLTDAELESRLEILRDRQEDYLSSEKADIVKDEIARRMRLNVGSGI